MARSLNRVQLIGNLGKDPELRATPSGKSVCTLSVATTESYKNSSGEWQDNTEWHRVVLWERLADVAAQYLKTGSKVFIEGRLWLRLKFEDFQCLLIKYIAKFYQAKFLQIFIETDTMLKQVLRL